MWGNYAYFIVFNIKNMYSEPFNEKKLKDFQRAYLYSRTL